MRPCAGLLGGAATATANVAMIRPAWCASTMSGSRRRCCASRRAAASIGRTARSTFASPGSAAPTARWPSMSPAARTRPQIALVAANPGFGIGLRDVEGDGPRDRWRLGDPGHRPVGLRAVRGRRRHPRRPRADDDRRQPADLRRHDFTGRLVRTRAGPFAGTLTHDRPGPRRHRPARRRRPLPAHRHRRHRQTARARRATSRS